MLNKMYAIFYYAQRKKNIINFKQLDFIMDKKGALFMLKTDGECMQE